MAYSGLVDDPLFADLNAFIDKSQERVTGTVKVKLYKGALTILAGSSPNSLYPKTLSPLTVRLLTRRMPKVLQIPRVSGKNDIEKLWINIRVF